MKEQSKESWMFEDQNGLQAVAQMLMALWTWHEAEQRTERIMELGVRIDADTIAAVRNVAGSIQTKKSIEPESHVACPNYNEEINE
jgi:hypothetical protein